MDTRAWVSPTEETYWAKNTTHPAHPANPANPAASLLSHWASVLAMALEHITRIDADRGR